MDLPPKGQEVSLEQIREICAQHNLQDLWNKIENGPPQKPFTSDGCSMWFDTWQDKSLYPASIELYNIQGKRVLSGTIYDNEQISVQELASGMHMYIIVTNNGKFSGKFMIK